MDQGRIVTLLQQLVRATEQTRNEICCKLRDLIIASGGSTTATVNPGIVAVSAGTPFTTVGSTNYRSVSMTIIVCGGGDTVTIDTEDSGTTDVSYQGYSAAWAIDKNSDIGLGEITITATGGAVILVNYTIEA
jgi:hypothetical protein